MQSFRQLIVDLKQNWSIPRATYEMPDGHPPFTSECYFPEEIAWVPDIFPVDVPPDVQEFWRNACTAKLFFCRNYGQWGLEILSPVAALKATTQALSDKVYTHYVNTDLIIGNFFGDSDCLIVDCSPERFGQIFVSGAIDKRQSWKVVANSFKEFMNRYVAVEGSKYWVDDLRK